MRQISQTITFAVSLFVCIALGGRLLDRGASLPALVGLFFGALALGMTISAWLMRRVTGAASR
jgi:hypothetical protein